MKHMLRMFTTNLLGKQVGLFCDAVILPMIVMFATGRNGSPLNDSGHPVTPPDMTQASALVPAPRLTISSVGVSSKSKRLGSRHLEHY
jgi:hypothetical protein